MRTNPSDRDSGWVHISDVPASLGDFIDDVRSEPLEIEIPYGYWKVSKARDGYTVRCIGSGGGFCWEREWSKTRLTSSLDTLTTDPKVKRPEPQQRGNE